MSGLLAAFRPLAERNYLRASGLPIPGFTFLGSDLPLRRGRFDRRFATGLLRPARKTILTARELSGFLKPPTVHCGERDVLRSGALLSPPPDLPDFDKRRADLIPLGQVNTESGEQSRRRPDRRHLLHLHRRPLALRQDRGGDRPVRPHRQERVTAASSSIPTATAWSGSSPTSPRSGDERVVRIDLGPGSSPADQPGWNLFEFGGDAVESEARVEAVVDAFASALEWGERSTRAINLTTQAAAALATIAQRLDAELAPTIFQIPTLLSDARVAGGGAALPAARRPALLDRPLPAAGRARRSRRSPTWSIACAARHRSGRCSARARAPTGCARRWTRARSSSPARGRGGTRDRLVANLLLFDLLHAARGRADLPPARAQALLGLPRRGAEL